MPIDDPATWGQAVTLLKGAFDTFRSAIGMVKDVQSLGGGTPEQQKAVDDALDKAAAAAAVAEAQIAKALGYDLRKCQFPPTIMTTVGYFNKPHAGRWPADPVYECPQCGYNTAGAAWQLAGTPATSTHAGW